MTVLLKFIQKRVKRYIKLIMNESLDEKAIKIRKKRNMPLPLSTEVKFKILPTPVKSASDKKLYRVIQLENGLTACLISDPSQIETSTQEDDDSDDDEDYDDDDDDHSSKTSTEVEDESQSESGSDNNDDNQSENEEKMAATSLCVNVGSFSDPKSVPGMAHFLEHMIFMGSEKFPAENDFDSFLTNRGGDSNASTDYESTCFYFQCLENDLFVALDKFAQFFITPLMKRSSIEKEIEAIHSEFQIALPSDSYRKEQLFFSFAKEESPVNSFSWGNLISLRDKVKENDLYDGVHKFRQRHYSAHRMTLAIQARLPLDKLESLVLSCFKDVPSNNLPPDDLKHFTNVFDTPRFTKKYYIEPTSEMLQVELTWALPSLLHKYKSKPLQYVSFLLGDEGKGSLLSYLRKKVWVLGMSTGNGGSGSENNSIYTLFTVTMSVTKLGFNHLDEVIEKVFSYINMLKKLGPQERIYNEIKVIDDTSFKFATEQSAVDTVEELSENMHYYPPEDYLRGSELYFEYDPDAIQKVVNSLVPRKMNIMIFCKDLPDGVHYNKTEPWFGTKYYMQDIPERCLEIWEQAQPLNEFSLPGPNEFLTQEFSLLSEEKDHPEYPQKILNTDLVEVWYRKDQKFKLPIAYYNFYLINPLTVETALSSAMKDFYINLLQILLVEYTYPAQIAQLLYNIKSGDRGVMFQFSGFNEKLHILIDLITKHIGQFESHVTEEMFVAMKDKMLKSYHNILLKPNGVAKDVRLNILIKDFHSVVDKYNVTTRLTLNDLKQFAQNFVQHLSIKVLVQGNVTKEHVISVVNNFTATLNCKPLNPDTYPKFRVVQLPIGESFCFVESLNKNDSNSIITNYYQTGPFTIQDSVIIEILMRIIEEPLFNTLRTEEQLGYDVRCSLRETYDILGFTITVNAQATKNTTQYVDARIEQFIKQVAQLLATMTEKSFNKLKRDFIKTKCVTDVHLEEEVSRNWSEIEDDDYIFDRRKQEIVTIMELKLCDLQKWWAAHSMCGTNFRKLSTQVAGFNTKTTTTEKLPLQIKRNEEEVHLAIKFLEPETNDMVEEEDKSSLNSIKNVDEFKAKLHLYPTVTKRVHNM